MTRWQHRVVRALEAGLVAAIVFCLTARMGRQLTTCVHKHFDKPEVEIFVAGSDSVTADRLVKVVPHWSHRVQFVNDTFKSDNLKGQHAYAETIARAYLGHIIENYDRLAHITVFHSSDWHQTLLDRRIFDSEEMLHQLRTRFVEQVGYVNLRCQSECPKAVYDTDNHEPSAGRPNEYADRFRTAFKEMLPHEPIPIKVAIPSSANFAVADWAVRRRPLEDYQRIHQWLNETELRHDSSDGVLSRTWHILFGMEAYSCPTFDDCQCSTFGLCTLDTDIAEGASDTGLREPLVTEQALDGDDGGRSRHHASVAWLQTEPLREPSAFE